MTLVEQGLRHEPRGVGEIDNPCVGSPDLRRPLGDLEHDGHGSERLGEASGPGGLLADEAEPEWDRLVEEPRLVPADAELHDHEVRSLERLGHLVGQPDRAGPPRRSHHALRERADDREPLRIDVQKDELVDRKAVGALDEPLHELRRVRTAAADHRHLHTHAPGIVHSGP